MVKRAKKRQRAIHINPETGKKEDWDREKEIIDYYRRKQEYINPRYTLKARN